MPLPALKNDNLPEGNHIASTDELIERFAGSGARKEFGNALLRFQDFAAKSGARYYLVGGSFLSAKDNPNDLDLIVVYSTKQNIPNNTHRFRTNLRIDVQFASEDEPEILNALLTMFRLDRNGRQVGVAVVQIADGAIKLPDKEVDPRVLEVVRETYSMGRIGAPRTVKRGVLVTIHGIRTHARWNNDVARFASREGWTVAPFVYGYRFASILIQRNERVKVINEFREWLDRLVLEEQTDAVSVVAHSLGTHIVGSYLFGFDVPPHRLNGVILTGSILPRDLDWESKSDVLGKVLHERAPNDKWARRMNLFNKFERDPLFGDSGAVGFSQLGTMVDERTCPIFDHNNAFGRDVIRGRWIPFLNAHDL
jgi:pimeloyl-ACP methyl ester carboxylesterase